jgi:hypothetical protein
MYIVHDDGVDQSSIHNSPCLMHAEATCRVHFRTARCCRVPMPVIVAEPKGMTMYVVPSSDPCCLAQRPCHLLRLRSLCQRHFRSWFAYGSHGFRTASQVVRSQMRIPAPAAVRVQLSHQVRKCFASTCERNMHFRTFVRRRFARVLRRFRIFLPQHSGYNTSQVVRK